VTTPDGTGLPDGARSERDGDDLAALTGDRQGPVPALQAQVLDVGAGGFGDPQPVHREQGEQRMLERSAELGRNERGAVSVYLQEESRRSGHGPVPRSRTGTRADALSGRRCG